MMIGSGNKGGFGFSWADEVEKEEQEAAAIAVAATDQTQQQQRQQKKPNPFGSARPGEVVLHDKGIDWSQLDLHLQSPSPSLNGFHQNEKLKRQSSPQLVTLSPQIQSPILCAPPLRYPPKYVAGILYEHWVSTTPSASHPPHCRIQKGNRSSGGGERKFTMRRNDFVEAKDEQQGKFLEGKENFHGRNSLCLPLVNQNIGDPEMQSNRMSLSANGIKRQPTNIQDSGMDKIVRATEQKRQKVTKKRQDLPKKQVNNGVHQKNFDKLQA